MSHLTMAFESARTELSCQRCRNSNDGITNGRGEQDECPECFGEGRNNQTLILLRLLVSEAEQARLSNLDGRK